MTNLLRTVCKKDVITIGQVVYTVYPKHFGVFFGSQYTISQT